MWPYERLCHKLLCSQALSTKPGNEASDLYHKPGNEAITLGMRVPNYMYCQYTVIEVTPMCYMHTTVFCFRYWSEW